jgi:rRNA maturation endonuclease Nob1
MTDAFAQSVGRRLKEAYNSKNREAVNRVFEQAEAEINATNLSAADKAVIWDAVRKEFLSSRLLLEKQEGSALHQLMRDIERRIAENKSQGES